MANLHDIGNRMVSVGRQMPACCGPGSLAGWQKLQFEVASSWDGGGSKWGVSQQENSSEPRPKKAGS